MVNLVNPSDCMTTFTTPFFRTVILQLKNVYHCNQNYQRLQSVEMAFAALSRVSKFDCKYRREQSHVLGKAEWWKVIRSILRMRIEISFPRDSIWKCFWGELERFLDWYLNYPGPNSVKMHLKKYKRKFLNVLRSNWLKQSVGLSMSVNYIYVKQSQQCSIWNVGKVKLTCYPWRGPIWGLLVSPFQQHVFQMVSCSRSFHRHIPSSWSLPLSATFNHTARHSFFVWLRAFFWKEHFPIFFHLAIKCSLGGQVLATTARSIAERRSVRSHFTTK